MSKELPNNEEVDLGQLFKLIGQGFSNIVAGIKRFFNGILNLFIKAALFIKKHFIKIAIVTLVGLAFGFYKDYTTPKIYSSSMLVKTNYDAKKQLYNEITSINNAFLQEESKAQFIKEFGLTKNDNIFAKITPVKSDIIQLEMFNKFIKQSDSVTVKNIDYNIFISNLSDMDFSTQKITIETTNPAIFEKIPDYLIKELNKNILLQKRIEVNLKNIEFEQQQLKKSLQDIDSLRIIYNKSLLAEANKLNSGTTTTIITAEQEGYEKVKELALYDKHKEILNFLRNLTARKAEETEVLQIVSNFPKYSAKNTKIVKTNVFNYGLIAFIAIIFLLLFIQFVSYLKTLE